MPCAKGMRQCHARCQHRDMVTGYRSARDAELAESESVSRGGWAARDDGKKSLTFKQWLKSSKVPEEFK